ncbi:MAG: hypothetical protein ABJA50_13430, partial [Chloroflexota bacterium]
EIIEDDMDLLLYWSIKMAGKYMGQDMAEDSGNRTAVPGELLIRVTPTKIAGYKKVAEWN